MSKIKKDIPLEAFGIFKAGVVRGLPLDLQGVYNWLGYHMNKKTGLCFPSISLLAEECGISVSNVIRKIKILEELGLIVRNCSKGKSNHYLINDVKISPIIKYREMTTCVTQTPVSHRHQCHADTTTSVTLTLLPVSHRHTNYKKVTRRNKPDELYTQKKYPDGFEEFLSWYPKTSRKNDYNEVGSIKNWQSRLKEGHSPDEMIMASKNYQQCCVENKTDPEFFYSIQNFIGRKKHFTRYKTIEPTINNNEANKNVKKYESKAEQNARASRAKSERIAEAARVYCEDKVED